MCQSKLFFIPVSSPYIYDHFNTVTYPNNTTISLQCTVAANPQPIITWYLDDVTLMDIQSENRGMRTGSVEALVKQGMFRTALSRTTEGDFISSLYISRSSVQTAGDYRCLATNDAGSAQHHAKVIING